MPDIFSDENNMDAARRRRMRRSLKSYRGALQSAWLDSAIDRLVASRQVAVSLTPNAEIAVVNNSAVFHAYKSRKELVTAMYSSVAGDSRKAINTGGLGTSAATGAGVGLIQTGDVTPAGAGSTTAASGSQTITATCFGWRVRVTGSVTNFSFRPITINVGTAVFTGGAANGDRLASVSTTAVLTLALFPRRLPLDVVVLNPANAGGLFTVVQGIGGATIVCTAAGTQTTTSNVLEVDTLGETTTFATVESLNQRDLIARSVYVGGARAGKCDDDAVYDAMETFGGIRDED